MEFYTVLETRLRACSPHPVLPNRYERLTARRREAEREKRERHEKIVHLSAESRYNQVSRSFDGVI